MAGDFQSEKGASFGEWLHAQLCEAVYFEMEAWAIDRVRRVEDRLQASRPEAERLIADRQTLLTVFDDSTLEELFPDHFNDMYQLQSLYSWKPAAFMVDKQSAVFHTLGPRSTDLVEQNNRLVNPMTGSAPSFVHAPAGWDLSAIEQWLAS